jgi:uncharacterized protein YggE
MKRCLLLCLLFAAPLCFAQPDAPPRLPDNTLVVTGSAERIFAADRAELSVTMRLDGVEPEALIAKMEALDATVRALARRHAPSSTVRLVDAHEYAWQARQNSRTLAISLPDVKALEPLAVRLASLAGVSVGRATFQSSEFAKNKRAARRQAAELAKEKAEDYASVLGRKLGPALIIEEVESPMSWYRSVGTANASTDSSRENGAPAGVLSVQQTVRVQFSLL